MVIYRRRSRLRNSNHHQPTLLPSSFGRGENRRSRGPAHRLDSDSDRSDALTFNISNVANESFSDSIGAAQRGLATTDHKEQPHHTRTPSTPPITIATATTTLNGRAPSLPQYTTGLDFIGGSGSENGSGNGIEEVSCESRGEADSEATVSREEYMRMRDEVLRLRGLQLQQQMTQNSDVDEVPPPYSTSMSL
jgi:hypothetical protein